MRVAALSRILGTKKMHSDFNAPLECPVTGNPFSGRSPNVFLQVYRNRKNKQEPSRPTSRTNKKRWLDVLIAFLGNKVVYSTHFLP